MQTPVVSRYSTPAHVHDFILLFLPPCSPHMIFVRPPSPSSRAYLSLHSTEATQAYTFRARSSPTPTHTKPLLTPAIFGQESVTPYCQSLITPRIDHPPVLGCSCPHPMSCPFTMLISLSWRMNPNVKPRT
jgi:hypothetical protein